MAVFHNDIMQVFCLVLSVTHRHCIEGDCNFDTGKCSWSNYVGSDKFDWTVGKSTAVSVNTGPYYDHTSGSGENSATHLCVIFSL